MFETKQNSTVSRHISPYLERMALTSTSKIKILRNLEPISRKKQNIEDSNTK